MTQLAAPCVEDKSDTMALVTDQKELPLCMRAVVVQRLTIEVLAVIPSGIPQAL